MNNNLIRKYNWLIQTLNVNEALTFQQISDLWQANRLLSKGQPLDWRKFQRWRGEINKVFGLKIGVTKRQPYMYYFDFPAEAKKSGAHEMFLDALAMQQFVLEAQNQKGVVLFGNYKPRFRFLDVLLRGIKENKIVKIHYRKNKRKRLLLEIKPMSLQYTDGTWQLTGANVLTDERELFSVDMIEEAVLTDQQFERLLF